MRISVKELLQFEPSMPANAEAITLLVFSPEGCDHQSWCDEEGWKRLPLYSARFYTQKRKL